MDISSRAVFSSWLSLRLEVFILSMALDYFENIGEA